MSRSPVRARVVLKAQALWDLMQRQNISQNQLARAMGTTSGYISQIISGKRCASPDMRRRLLNALGNPPFDDLFILERDHE